VRLDLDRVGIPVEAQRLDELAREGRPVDARIRRQVRVVVADGAVDLAQQADGRDLLALPVQAIDDVRHLLAQGGW
jgi:hypothetical protein